MSSSNKLVIAAFCGLALILLLLSSPLQQIYWATTAQLLEAKGVIRRDQYRLGQHLLAAPVTSIEGKHHSQQRPSTQQSSNSSNLASLVRQAQQHLSRLRTPKLHASAADSIDVQHSNTNTLTSHADLDDVLQQARHLGFEAKIHIDRSHLSEPHEPLSNQSAATGTDAASDEVTELKLGTDAHQPQLQLTQSAEPQSTESAQNLTELVKLLTAHGLNLSGSPQEQSQHARMDATSLHQDSSAQHTTQLLDEVDETQSGDVSISIPLGHLSQTAAAELSLIHQTSQNLAISDRAENATHFLDPLLTNATVPAARTAGSAAHALPADSIDAHHEASHLHDAQQAMPPGLHHHADTDSDAQPSVSPGLEQPQVQPTGANSGVNNGTQQHMHDAVAFSSVFSGTEQALLQLTTPAATSTKQQQQQGEVTTDSASNGTEVQLQQLGNDEGDPSVNYSPEMAVVEPAEPIASDIHKEEEAHKAVAPLLVQHANETGSHKLTKELVQSVAPDGLIMVTWANFHYLDFTMNWVQHVKSAGISAYLVGAMDDDLLHELVARQGREKIGLVLAFTSMDFDVLVSDVDTVWLRNPMPYMAAYPEAKILVSSDSLHATTEDGGLELYPNAGVANIGIMLFRSEAKVFAEEWNRALLADDKYWDQNAFNDLMNRGAQVSAKQRTDRLFWGYDGSMMMGILPVATFCSGHTFFVQHMADVLGLEPYVVHATFQFSGTPGKRHRMREALLWDADPEEYFRPPGGLLTFDMHLGDLINQSVPYQQEANPANSPAKSMKLDDTKTGHFNLVIAQLQQVRSAMALASSLGRTLVMPQLWCGMDRWWAPHDGNIPGSSLKLPFPCPMDHIFDLEQMIQKRPEEAFGPFIDWREYSLLNNSKLPAEDKAQAVQVHVCQGSESGCSSGGSPAKLEGLKVALQHSLTDRQLQTALQDLSGVAVLHFDDVRTAFGGHAEAVNATRFQQRTEVYTSLWCCVNAHPGHVWYDIWWDVIPHEDRHKHAIQHAWKPTTGP